MSGSFEVEFVSSIQHIGKNPWQALAKNAGIFLHYEFLAALESSGAVCTNSGWQPHHAVLQQADKLIGVLPLYIKYHSYGEYVFDHAWAHAYQQHGLQYYPKLLNAIPFTPVSGSRLLLDANYSLQHVLPALCQQLKSYTKHMGCSSMHWLFPPAQTSELLAQQAQVQRKAVQFEWYNRNYHDFDDFLATFASRKRKNVKKERHKVQQAGVTIQRLSGQGISDQALQHFYDCYQQTYLKRSGHNGYLNWAFFRQIKQKLSDHMLLVIAQQNEQPVASALFFYDRHQLSGRYWGTLQDIDGLHFECCYYQGIEFCIQHQIKRFNPGTQGEHKILRGFEPTYCYSNHWLADSRFHRAVEQFVKDEHQQLAEYKRQAESLLPFKTSS